MVLSTKQQLGIFTALEAGLEAGMMLQEIFTVFANRNLAQCEQLWKALVKALDEDKPISDLFGESFDESVPAILDVALKGANIHRAMGAVCNYLVAVSQL